MSGVHTSSLHRIVLGMLITLSVYGLGYQDAIARDVYPSAPTVSDAHQFFESLVSSNGVTALYETFSNGGDILGYESFPVQDYVWAACHSGVNLKNGVKIDINWAVVDKSQPGDGSLSILHGHNVQFISIHMVSVEGGITIESSNAIPKLILGINDELSRNRLSKAIDLLSSACRAKSKFD